MLENLNYRKLSLAARLCYIWLGRAEAALIRVWPETMARELNLEPYAVYAALDELAAEGLCYFEADQPLCWLPDLPFSGNVRGLPRCELLARAMEFYGAPCAAAFALPAVFRDRRREGTRQAAEEARLIKVKAKLQKALRLKAEKAKAELEGSGQEGEGGAGERSDAAAPVAQAADAPILLNNFNINTARAEEESKINILIKNSSSSAKAGASFRDVPARAFMTESSSSSASSASSASSSMPRQPLPECGPYAAPCPGPKERAINMDFAPLAENGADPGQAYPGQGYPEQAYPGQGYPEQGYPGQGHAEEALAKACGISCSPAPAPYEKRQKAGHEGGRGENAEPLPDFPDFSPDGDFAGKGGEEAYAREGRDLIFLNCMGEGESISKSAVALWKEAFPGLDMDLELSGIAVWLAGHYGDERKGGPLPGRLNMENYIANCLRLSARRQAAGEKLKRQRPKRRMPDKCWDEVLAMALGEK